VLGDNQAWSLWGADGILQSQDFQDAALQRGKYSATPQKKKMQLK
jgi:hypothetical protein